MKEMDNLEADNAYRDHGLEVGMVLGSRFVTLSSRTIIA